ncbi:uncharacterized protein CDV56_104994 [Aspergillus thermomutatus]|uniref:Uncharacterized protein n=1 Tax=Aspergillus thermomutatus TaxID=41047 RepID=A0A397GCN6_ASPTH|nr:uncharacterized protein CDV56_104994 [Aspergillus thermomutatus]RHZ48792.1 hypothetical protein CDV56_104994 [Aspergillus thermomutatus]
MSSPLVQRQKLINSILRHAKNGDWEGLSQLLDNLDVMTAGLEYRHNNPLHEAIVGGHPEIVQRLIDQGFSVEEKGANAYSVKCMTPLHLAAWDNQVQIARILLEAGADPTRLDVTDSEETHAVSRVTRTAFMTAAYWDSAEVLQLLIDRLLPSNQISPREWEQAVADAAANRHAKSLEILLRYYPGPVCQQILDQALAQAAAYCLWDEHEMMLRPQTVLWESQIQVIRLLLERGANPNWMGGDSQQLTIPNPALSHLDRSGAVDHRGIPVLAQAVFNGNPQIVRFFLETTGVAVNKRLPSERWYKNSSIYCPLGGSLLHVAAYGAPLETIQLLLANGADSLAQDDNHALPFHSACQAGRIDVVELLWSLSDSDHLESKVTKDGRTPLLLALGPASYDASALSVLTFLIEKGADVNAQDRLGRTPLAFYIQQQGPYARERVIDLLRKHGADTEVIRDSEGRTAKDWAIEKRSDFTLAMTSRPSRPKKPIALRTEYLASSTTTIRVKQHSKSWSGGDFTVSTVPSDGSPAQTLFTVDGDFASVSQRRRVQDATGLPLFEIARKRLGVTWFVHLPGSKEKDNPQPIATIVPQWHMLKDKFDVHFKNAAGGGGIGLSVRGQDVWKSRTHVYHADALVMTSKLKDMVSVYIPGKRPEWEIEVAEGMDLSLASIIGVLLATLLYQSSGKGKAPKSVGEDDDPAVGTSKKASLT